MVRCDAAARAAIIGNRLPPKPPPPPPPLPDARLRGDARGSDRGVRQELAACLKEKPRLRRGLSLGVFQHYNSSVSAWCGPSMADYEKVAGRVPLSPFLFAPGTGKTVFVLISFGSATNSPQRSFPGVGYLVQDVVHARGLR